MVVASLPVQSVTGSRRVSCGHSGGLCWYAWRCGKRKWGGVTGTAVVCVGTRGASVTGGHGGSRVAAGAGRDVVAEGVTQTQQGSVLFARGSAAVVSRGCHADTVLVCVARAWLCGD